MSRRVLLSGWLVFALLFPSAPPPPRAVAAAPAPQAAPATPTPVTPGPAVPKPQAPPTPAPSPTAVSTPAATPTIPRPGAPNAGTAEPEVDVAGGTIDLARGAKLELPAGGLAGRSRFSSHSVERRLTHGLTRFHPVGEPIYIEAHRADTQAAVGRLLKAARLRLDLDDDEIRLDDVDKPAIRVLGPKDWELVPSSFDSRTKTITVELDELPATIAVVDDGQPVGEGGWDPKDPAGLQFSDGAWGVAYTDAALNPSVLYKRTLGSDDPLYWLDALTVDSGDAPAMVKLGGTTALFYRKGAPTVKQVFLRTSTDDGLTWSAATQLTTETVSVYQIQASIHGGTVYLFWSRSDTSGTLQYKTSSDLAGWSGASTVGQAIGPLQNNTSPSFDIKKLSSGTWGLAWQNVSPGGEIPGTANNTSYPVVWSGTSSDLSATTWSNKQELTLAWSERWAKAVSLGQTSSGTVYLSYTHYVYPWDYYAYYRTSSNDGATWSAKTKYAYEPGRTAPDGSNGVLAHNSHLVLDNSGNLRSFWDQESQVTPTLKDAHAALLHRRDLPSGEILPIPVTVDVLAKAGPCEPGCAYRGDPINTNTGHFTLPETDFAIPARGLGLVFTRTYNAVRRVDGPLGFGWTHLYDTRLKSYSGGQVLIVDGSGRSDLYKPAGGGAYTPPPGHFGTLVQNGDGTWTLTERNQIKRTFSSAGKLTAIADRNNNSLALAYDGSARLSTVSDPSGRSLTFTYTGSRIATITDPLGRVVTFTYNAGGDLTSVVDPRGKTWTYTYDSVHRMLTKVDPLNHTVLTNTYGSIGRIRSQKDAKLAETRFEYTYAGGSTSAFDPLNNKTTYAFDTQYRTTIVTDPANKQVFFYYDTSNNLTRVEDKRKAATDNTYFTHDSRGNVLTRKNGLNNIWTFTYNATNDLLSQTDPLNHSATFTYNASGSLTAVTNAKNETTSFGRNGFGQLTSITDARGKLTTFGYDAYGNQTTVTNPLLKTWTTAFDLAGRKTSVADPLTHTTSFAYDPNSNLTSATDARGKVTSYVYDNANNRTSVTDPNLKTTTYAYDEKNRLLTVTDAATGVTTYVYNGNDSLTSATDASNHARTWTHDNLGRVLTETDALNKVTTFEYDGAGNRTKRTDANTAITTYAYDTINRRTSITYPVGSVSYVYDAANRTTSMTDGTGATTYAYDELDRPSSVTLPGTRVVSYLYDPTGNRTRITYPDTKTVDYGYDDANRLASVTDWLTKITGYSYDDAGRLSSTSFPTGVVEARTYTDADQLLTIVATKGANTLTSFTYTLDNAGLRTAVQDPSGTESYAFDNLYRLTGVSYPDAVTQSYTYDSVGNRLTKVQGATTSYTYDNGDRMTTAGGVTYTYDNNGNQTARGADTYTWDTENRLTGATVAGTTVSAAYRGDGLRHSRTIGAATTTYTWDVASGLPVVLQDGSFSYVYGLGLISQTDNAGTQTYFLGNGLGSTEVLTDASGVVVATYKYDAFGAVRSSTGSASTEYRFTGQQDDTALSLTYLRARYYDPATGRFLSKDPWPGTTASPSSQHSYGYVGGNPLNAVDPSGFVKVEVRFIQFAVPRDPDNRPLGQSVNAIHAYIVVTDNLGTGAQTYYSGQPLTVGGGNDLSRAILVGESGPHKPGSREWNQPGELAAAARVLVDDQSPVDCANQILQNFANNVTAAAIPYRLLSTNSNAFAYTAMLELYDRGIATIDPLARYREGRNRPSGYAPGFGVDLRQTDQYKSRVVG